MSVMGKQEEAAAHQLEQREDVKKALRQTSNIREPAKPIAETGDRVLLGTYVLVLLGLAILYYLFGLSYFGLPERIKNFLLRTTRGGILITLVLTASQIVKIYLIGRVLDGASRYNLKRVLRLMVGLILGFIIISVIFVNWYTAVVSLGLISLVLGFALQTPITSFIGWVYILVREPYRVGDRIKIGDATGDVIDVSYLDTTLWEFGGQYLSTDHPSGRIIKFPNSDVLGSAVYNYSWPLFPYIWNEISFNIAYESDLEFVAKAMQETAEVELGEDMLERVRVFRNLLEKTPVDELEVREHPTVIFRVNENTWIEAIVRYLVEPKRAGQVKTRLIKKMLERLNAEPDRVMFPKSNSR